MELENMADNKRGLGIVTKQEIRRLKEILTFEEYESVIRRLIDTAINAEKDRDALQAAIYIIDRIEGKIPVSADINVTGNRTINDLLKNADENTG